MPRNGHTFAFGSSAPGTVGQPPRVTVSLLAGGTRTTPSYRTFGKGFVAFEAFPTGGGAGAPTGVTWQVSNDGTDWTNVGLGSIAAVFDSFGAYWGTSSAPATPATFYVPTRGAAFARMTMTPDVDHTCVIAAGDGVQYLPVTTIGSASGLGGYLLNSGNSTSVVAVGTYAADGTATNLLRLRVIADEARLSGSSTTRVRDPNTFKTVTTAASGATAVWTPAAGKKFRLMSYSVEVTADAKAAAAADLEITWLDSASALGIGSSVFVPNAAGTTFADGYETGWRTLGNGILSAAANNVLNVNLSFSLTGGEVRVNTAGTEE